MFCSFVVGSRPCGPCGPPGAPGAPWPKTTATMAASSTSFSHMMAPQTLYQQSGWKENNKLLIMMILK
jgi:hypothetical protein